MKNGQKLIDFIIFLSYPKYFQPSSESDGEYAEKHTKSKSPKRKSSYKDVSQLNI